MQPPAELLLIIHVDRVSNNGSSEDHEMVMVRQDSGYSNISFLLLANYKFYHWAFESGADALCPLKLPHMQGAAITVHNIFGDFLTS